MEKVVCRQKYSINLLLILPSSGRVLIVKTIHWLTRTSVQPPCVLPPCLQLKLWRLPGNHFGKKKKQKSRTE